MAVITWEVYAGTPSWIDLAGNRLIFSNSLSDIEALIAPSAFQNGTHIGDGTPGTDQCGGSHVNNVKIITSATMSVNGAPSEVINDSNLADTECTFRLHFNDTAAYALQNSRIYTYDGTTSDSEATGVDAALYIKGQGMTNWFTINSSSSSGPAISGMLFTTPNLGGDNSSEYSSLASRAAAADHYYYCALSASPETVTGKTAFAIGAYVEYF